MYLSEQGERGGDGVVGRSQGGAGSNRGLELAMMVRLELSWPHGRRSGAGQEAWSGFEEGGAPLAVDGRDR